MAPLTEFEGNVESALRRLEEKTSFCEATVQGARGADARVDSKSVGLSAVPRLSGVVFRAWAGDHWVEASSSDLSPEALGSTLALLDRPLAKVSSKAAPPGSPSTLRGEKATRPAKPVSAMSPGEMISRLKEARDWALNLPSIIEVQARLAWNDEERLYLNSAGARCHQTISRATFSVIPIAMENGRVDLDYLIGGGEGGQEILSELSEAKVVETARDSKALLSAKAPPTGEMSVLLDPSVAGLFAHESFGHGTEADQFTRDRSYLKPLLGSRVGPDMLTIADDGAYADAWGSIYFDDEGHPGRKNRLVDHGQFTGALHDRETAAVFHTQPTGNTRRSDFLSRVFVRMTNTYVEPGDHTFEELVAETKDGVLLEHGSSGIEDPLGGQMQLKVQKGHRIEHGKVTDLLPSMALSGSVLTFLQGIRGVGKRSSFSIEPGFCGKGHGDYIPVGTGGVYVLSRAVVGPA